VLACVCVYVCIHVHISMYRLCGGIDSWVEHGAGACVCVYVCIHVHIKMYRLCGRSQVRVCICFTCVFHGCVCMCVYMYISLCITCVVE